MASSEAVLELQAHLNVANEQVTELKQTLEEAGETFTEKEGEISKLRATLDEREACIKKQVGSTLAGYFFFLSSIWAGGFLNPRI